MSGSHDKELISPVALTSVTGIVIDDFTTGPYTVQLTDKSHDYHGTPAARAIGGVRWTNLSKSPGPSGSAVTLNVGSRGRLKLGVGAGTLANLQLAHGYNDTGPGLPVSLELDLSDARAIKVEFDAIGARGFYVLIVTAFFTDPATGTPLWASTQLAYSDFVNFRVTGPGQTSTVELPLDCFVYVYDDPLQAHWTAEKRTHVNQLSVQFGPCDDLGLISIEAI